MKRNFIFQPTVAIFFIAFWLFLAFIIMVKGGKAFFFEITGYPLLDFFRKAVIITFLIILPIYIFKIFTTYSFLKIDGNRVFFRPWYKLHWSELDNRLIESVHYSSPGSTLTIRVNKINLFNAIQIPILFAADGFEVFGYLRELTKNPLTKGSDK